MNRSGSKVSNGGTPRKMTHFKSFKDILGKGVTLEKKHRNNTCGFYRGSHQIPPIVEQTCKYLEHFAIQKEGIFRVSGSQEDIRRIKDKYDKGKKVDLFKEEDAHTVAGVLKLFFTELENPVLAHELYPSFMSAIELENELLRLWCVKRTIETLPPGNRAVIDRVCAMLSIISGFQEDNKMSAKNLAVVIHGSVFRDKDESMQKFMSTGSLRVRLVELLIVHYQELFVRRKEELDAQVKNIEDSLPLETQKQLDKFSEILKEGAIALAKNLLNEGETEITVQFDSTNAFVPSPRLPTDEQMKDMSFEEFAAHLALHPPGGMEIGMFNQPSGSRLEFSEPRKRGGRHLGTVQSEKLIQSEEQRLQGAKIQSFTDLSVTQESLGGELDNTIDEKAGASNGAMDRTEVKTRDKPAARTKAKTKAKMKQRVPKDFNLTGSKPERRVQRSLSSVTQGQSRLCQHRRSNSGTFTLDFDFE